LALKRISEWEELTEPAIKRAKTEKKIVIEGDHWPADVRTDREGKGLPCLVLNHGIVHRDGVSGEISQNMPQGKYRGFDDNNDPKMADIGNGILRRIEANSNIEDLDHETVKQTLISGYPSWQYVYHDYPARTFRQEIFIRNLPGQFSVGLDPHAKAMDSPERGGPRYGFMFEMMPRHEYEKEYPGCQLVSIDGLQSDEINWWSATDVRVCSYFVAEGTKGKLLLIGDLEIIENSDEHKELLELAESVDATLRVDKERPITTYKIMHYRINSREILSGPDAVAGEFIPLIPFEGKYDILDDGRKFYRGVYSNAIDANRMQDLWASKATENVATGRQFKATVAQIGPHGALWENSVGKKVLYFEVDPLAPTIAPQEVDTTTEMRNDIAMMEYAGQQIKDLTNRHEASLGSESNETSGRAILARAQQGNNSNYEFVRNIAAAVRYRTKVIESQIPEIYDYKTTIRILGDDGREKRKEVINEPAKGMDEAGQAIETYLNDTTKARFNTVVDTGPSFKTQRMEASALMGELAQSVPEMGKMLYDLIVRSNDFIYADEASKRIKWLLDKQFPGMIDSAASDGDGGGDGDMQAKMEQATAPIMAELEQAGQMVQQLQAGIAEGQNIIKAKEEELKRAIADFDLAKREIQLQADTAVAKAEIKSESLVQQMLALKAADDKIAALTSDIQVTKQMVESLDRTLEMTVMNAKDAGTPDPEIASVSEQLKNVSAGIAEMQKKIEATAVAAPAVPQKVEQEKNLTVIIDNKGGTVRKTISLRLRAVRNTPEKSPNRRRVNNGDH
jgi:hypothetical protein